MAEVTTKLGYYNRQPVICLAPKYERTSNRNKRFLISMHQLYEYSEDHNATFEQHMRRITQAIMERFDLGEPTSKKMAEIAAVIQSRIDDLLKVPPLDPVFKVVGEAKVTAAGETFEHAIKDEIDGDGYKQYSD